MMITKLYHYLLRTTRRHGSPLLLQARHSFPGQSRLLCTNSSDLSLESVLATQTVGECYSRLHNVLTTGHVHEADICAQYIVAHVLGCSTLAAVDHHRPVNKPDIVRVMALAQNSLLGQPIQYVLGEWQFRDLLLKMRPPVFIPRPETEELVSLVIADNAVKNGNIFLEVGCGSGAICISLLTECPHMRGIAIDTSAAACELTQMNAAAAGVAERLEIRCTDITLDIQDAFDLIVSNPPYIPAAEMCHLQKEIVNYEDHAALNGGEDGIYVIRRILDAAHNLLKPSGSIWLEVDSRHPRLIKKYVEHSRSLLYQQTVDDFRHFPRFCQLNSF